jgi:hypothetical protein
MDTGAEIRDGFRSSKEETALARFARWFIRRLERNSDGLPVSTDSLLQAFRTGFPITHLVAGKWFATLEAIDCEDNQVAALVRLSRLSPLAPAEPRRGMVALEERGRQLFVAPASANHAGNVDLLLVYTFPLLLPLEKNLSLFREFAGNEIGRLRGASGGAKKT